MNLRLLEKFIQQGRLTVIGHDGRERTFGEGEPSATWRLNGPSTFMRILRNPQLNLGETYMDGEWDVGEGTLHDLLTILRINLEPKVSGRRWLDPLRAVLRSWNGLAASRRNVSHHYDLDEPLFRACLDTDMHYSCAYFTDPQLSLEDAQAAKCRHIAAKLNLEPGQKVLDIGSGWGSLA
ncbi:MAG: SAM-dependent methyltransferase, partial [Gammaproteobacteria bacterium]|nr:SAM-dependent methyltransferase [Gammaproteobacteria bacterium]